jgi:hypothetical protein
VDTLNPAHARDARAPLRGHSRTLAQTAAITPDVPSAYATLSSICPWPINSTWACQSRIAIGGASHSPTRSASQPLAPQRWRTAFLSEGLALLCLIVGSLAALSAGRRIFSRRRPPRRRIAHTEDVSSPIPQWLVASSVLLFAGLGIALSLGGVGVVGFVVAFVVAAFGVTGIFTAIGWRRRKTRRR